MIGDATDPTTFAVRIAGDGRQICVQRGTHRFIEQRYSIFRAEDHMDEDKREGSWHRKNYRSGLQPSTSIETRTWGFAPCWYSVAPLALFAVATLACVMPLIGCGPQPLSKKEVAEQAAKPTTTAVQYPARPTTPPPPFKLFHQTDSSLTLVTKEAATDDEISAILWQLRDAAHAHTFDALHLPQAFIDKRDPIVWFHLYRGSKCASEKYAAKLPCDASYHAAGDYTYGGYANHERDDGELLHGEGHSLQLWNPDAPYTPPPPGH